MMKISKLRVGSWYRVNYRSEDGTASWRGKAMLVQISPRSYDATALKMICADGTTGFFCGQDLVCKTTAPKQLNQLILKICQKNP